MAEKNVSITITTKAWNTSTSAPKTGDAANISAEISIDGAQFVASINSVSEVQRADASASGRYALVLEAAEMNGDDVRIAFWSSTANVQIEDVHIVTQELEVTIPELSQTKPTATPTIKTALMLLYMAIRNKATATANEQGIYNDAGTKIVKATLTDDGTTFTKNELETGA